MFKFSYVKHFNVAKVLHQELLHENFEVPITATTMKFYNPIVYREKYSEIYTDD